MNSKHLAWWFIFVVAAFILLACIPIAAIWSVNVLFGLGIVVSFKTWAAALILCGLIASNRAK